MKEILILPILPLCDPAYLVLFSWQVIYRTIALNIRREFIKSHMPLMSTDPLMTPERMIELFVDRRGLEVTFEETREHLGVETQRQWSDRAIARSTPVLIGLYSCVCLMANRLGGRYSEAGASGRLSWATKSCKVELFILAV